MKDLFVDIFQLLIRLCAYVPAVEELARKDDLTLLFSAVTSPVPEHNLVTILSANLKLENLLIFIDSVRKLVFSKIIFLNQMFKCIL